MYHYRGSFDLEADITLQMPDGNWGALEMKLSSRMIDKAVEHLLRLKDAVDTYGHALRFLAMVTGTELTYRRGDGVYVVPAGILHRDPNRNLGQIYTAYA